MPLKGQQRNGQLFQLGRLLALDDEILVTVESVMSHKPGEPPVRRWIFVYALKE